jgi:hypothetical protein
MKALLIFIIMSLCLLFFPYVFVWLWAWIVPDIAPRAVREGYVSATITWWTAFKIWCVPALATGVAKGVMDAIIGRDK